MNRATAVVIAILAGASVVPVPVSASPPAPFVDAERDVARIVAVGDVHGAHDALVAILRKAELLDPQHRWIGGEAVLVQTGDFLDRGPDVRAVIDLLRSLQDQARRNGGRVVVLLGNHEVLNLMGDWSHVSAEAVAPFADAESERRRRRAWERRAEILESLQESWGVEPGGSLLRSREEWMAARPPGLLEYAAALSADGEYGRWLRELPVAAKVGGSLFVHGGIGPGHAALPLRELDDTVREDVRSRDELRRLMLERDWIAPSFDLDETIDVAMMLSRASLSVAAGERPDIRLPRLTSRERELLIRLLRAGAWMSFDEAGPLWYRGYSELPEEELADLVAAVLETHGARRLVVGHTPQPDGRIRERLDGRLFLIDTGMLAPVYGGRPAALEILVDGVRSIPLGPGSGPPSAAADRSVPRPASGASDPPSAAPEPEPSWRGPEGEPLPFRGHEQALEFLRLAEPVEIREIGEGVTRPKKVLLERGGIRAHAIFHDVDVAEDRPGRVAGKIRMRFRDSHLHQRAAYRVSRLLGLDVVPPTVVREIDGRRGSLQLWIENAINERRRQELRLHPPDGRVWSHYRQVAKIFDYLIANDDRNAGNLLIDRATWKLWLVDHTRAFQRSPDDNEAELRGVQRCPRSLWTALRSWDPGEAKRRLGAYLDGGEIDALAARRDRLVAHLEDLIRKRGAAAVIYDDAFGEASRR